MSRPCYFTALCVLITFGCGVASAKPRHTKFEKMMQESPTIVVAKYAEKQPDGDSEATLEILRVFCGEVKPGRITVNTIGTPEVDPKDGEFVAFLDEKTQLCFLAVPLSGKKIAGAALRIDGVCCDNRHYVTPGLATEEMLKAYLKDGALNYRFRGAIHFPQPGKREWKAGSLTLAGSYDAVGKKAAVRGLPNPAGLPEQPLVHVGNWDGTNIDLVYSRYADRPLELQGKVEDLDPKTSEFLVRFVVRAPEVLSEKALTDYLADDGNGSPIVAFKLSSTPVAGQVAPKALSLVIGRKTELADQGIQIGGWEKELIEVTAQGHHGRNWSRGSRAGGKRFPEVVEEELGEKDGVYRMAAKTGTGDTLVLAFEVERARPDVRLDWSRLYELLYPLHSGEPKGAVYLSDGKTLKKVATFTTAYESTTFNHLKK